jgi:hypothetical protein
MLRKLRAAIQPPAPAGSGSPASQPTAVMLSGGLEVGVVGESHHQDALTAIVGGKGPDSVRIPTQATLVPEPDNPMTPPPSPFTSPGGRSGTSHDRPPMPSHRWPGDSPTNNASAPVRRPLLAAGIAGTVIRGTSASSSTWPIPTNCCRATDYESLPDVCGASPGAVLPGQVQCAVRLIPSRPAEWRVVE